MNNDKEDAGVLPLFVTSDFSKGVDILICARNTLAVVVNKKVNIIAFRDECV